MQSFPAPGRSQVAPSPSAPVWPVTGPAWPGCGPGGGRSGERGGQVDCAGWHPLRPEPRPRSTDRAPPAAVHGRTRMSAGSTLVDALYGGGLVSPTSGAVSWSSPPLALARRTLLPPRHPRCAGRRERAAAPPPDTGMVLTLAGRCPLVSRLPYSGVCCHGDKWREPSHRTAHRRPKKSSPEEN